MDTIADKINKLSLPVVILIASVILGGLYYASQVNKQRSIERQQKAKMDSERVIKQELLFRQECKDEKKDDFRFFDESSLSPELVMIGLKNKGYVDDRGNFVDDDVWIKSCVERKLEIWIK